MRCILNAPLLALLALLAGCGGGSSDETSLTGGPPPPEVLAMESNVHTLINIERADNGEAPLTHDEALRSVARGHSEDMIARSFFSHTNPDGLSPFDRMALDNIEYLTAGENIAWNRGYADPAQSAVDAWMNSPGHRANILNGTFTHAGLGVAQRVSDGAWYFTQLFSLPTGSLVAMTWVVHEETGADSLDQATSSWSLGTR